MSKEETQEMSAVIVISESQLGDYRMLCEEQMEHLDRQAKQIHELQRVVIEHERFYSVMYEFFSKHIRLASRDGNHEVVETLGFARSAMASRYNNMKRKLEGG